MNTHFRKSILAGLLCVVISFSSLAQAGTYSGGEGTAAKPYKIATLADWLELIESQGDWDKHFVLLNDIDFEGTMIAPIAPDLDPLTSDFQGISFEGMFDGRGHLLKNFVIRQTDHDYVGLFGKIDNGGHVQNMGIELLQVLGRSYVGGLAGISYGNISACYAKGAVSGSSYVGGLVGVNKNVGWISSGTISSCYSTGSVSGTSIIGGLCGSNTGTISSCYSTGSVSGDSILGGLVGINVQADTTNFITNSFWDIQTSGITTSAGGTGKTTAQMMDINTFLSAGWDFVGETSNGVNDYWQMEANNYPGFSSHTWTLAGEGTPDHPFVITNAADIGKVWLRPMGYFRLNNDLDLSDISWSSSVVPEFSGVFDGDGFTISFVTINLPGVYNIGFFGRIRSGSQVQNLSIESIAITGQFCVGGLVGVNSGDIINYYQSGSVTGNTDVGGLSGINYGMIESSQLIGSVKSLGADPKYKGGLTAYNYGTIKKCSVIGEIEGPFEYAGGLCAINIGTISESFAVIPIISVGYYGGGLCGFNTGQISLSYADTNIVGMSGYGTGFLGGLVGVNSGFIEQCYSTGAVTGAAYYSYLNRNGYGGLVGSNSGTIVDCYSIGSVSGFASECGGLVGFNSGAVIASFWDIQTSGIMSSHEGKGLSTDQMKTMTTFQKAGWADKGWVMNDHLDYPRLSWEDKGGEAIPPAIIPFAGSGTAESPYLISTAQEFAELSWYTAVLNKHIQLTGNIDLSDVALYPIGNLGRFCGVFDGNGYILSNGVISQPDNNYVGLFNILESDGQVRNLGVNNLTINGRYYVGGLVGLNSSGFIASCYVSGTIEGASYVGGLVGSLSSGAVTDSCSMGSVTSTSSLTYLPCDNSYSIAGGLVGSQSSGAISRCYSESLVSSSTPPYSGNRVIRYLPCAGGLVGVSEGAISDSYSTGSVTTSTGVSTLSHNYACYSDTGGLVGNQSAAGVISNCYSTGIVSSSSFVGITSSSYVGGLIGRSTGSTFSCFWDIETSGMTESAGGTGKTTAEMQTLFTFRGAGWDFTNETTNGTNDIWRMCTYSIDYPRLNWESIKGDFTCPDGVNTEDLNYYLGYWLMNNCTIENNYCDGVDLNKSGVVDLADWAIFAENWLNGVNPSYIDDFNDNVMGSLWTLMNSNPSAFWLDETNQRLEIRSTGATDDLALYVPNEWSLDTSRDFGFKIHYHNEVESAAWSGLLLALGDPSDIEDNHIQFSVCSYDDDGYNGPLFYYELMQGGTGVDELYVQRVFNDGWVYVSYDAVLDELYLGINGYGSNNAFKTVSGLMHGAWAGKTIAPHIGGSSDHVAMLSGKAYWDDLILDYGDIADPDMDITWISISDPGVPDHEGFDGQMSKYETTNAQFAYYLNRAIETGDIIVDGSYVKGAIGWNSGQDFTGQNYYDLAGSGTTYNGATNGGAARIHWMGSSFTVDSGFENHPVTYVSWYGAKAFASYFGWRLPTEWEWQAVADYNGTFNYGCGTTLNNDIANYRNSVHPDGTTVVGALGTYGFGVCDMAGNVFEWTDSCYYANCDGNYRVLRGGSWAFYDYYCSVSYRYYYNPFGLGISFGFRVCR